MFATTFALFPPIIALFPVFHYSHPTLFRFFIFAPAFIPVFYSHVLLFPFFISSLPLFPYPTISTFCYSHIPLIPLSIISHILLFPFPFCYSHINFNFFHLSVIPIFFKRYSHFPLYRLSNIYTFHYSHFPFSPLSIVQTFCYSHLLLPCLV